MEFFLININILFLILIVFIIKVYENFRKYKFIESFESYMLVLNYFMEKAYDMIYKDSLLIYSVEAMKVDEEQFSQISKGFANLTINLIGPKIHKEFSEFFGNEDVFLFNLIEFFNTKYEGDEIRKTAIGNLMESED